MHWPLHRMDIARNLTRLILEQVDGMAGVVPEQVIGPAARLALEIDVLAAEEKCLHHEMLQLELAGHDPVVNPLMRRIEPARMPGHGDQTACLLRLVDRRRVRQRIGDRNFDLDVLAGLQALNCLCRLHLGRRGDNCGVDAGLVERLGEVRRPVRNTVFPGNGLDGFGPAAGEADDLDAVDVLESIQVLLAKRTLANHDNLHENLRGKGRESLVYYSAPIRLSQPFFIQNDPHGDEP